MKPISFKEQTQVIGKNQPEYMPMPAHQMATDKGPTVVICWKLTWAERIRVLVTGTVWHMVTTFGKAIQPQLLVAEKPKMEKPSLPQK